MEQEATSRTWAPYTWPEGVRTLVLLRGPYGFIAAAGLTKSELISEEIDIGLI